MSLYLNLLGQNTYKERRIIATIKKLLLLVLASYSDNLL